MVPSRFFQFEPPDDVEDVFSRLFQLEAGADDEDDELSALSWAGAGVGRFEDASSRLPHPELVLESGAGMVVPTLFSQSRETGVESVGRLLVVLGLLIVGVGVGCRTPEAPEAESHLWPKGSVFVLVTDGRRLGSMLAKRFVGFVGLYVSVDLIFCFG